MREINLDLLKAAIARPTQLPEAGSRFIISEPPVPYVAPTLRVLTPHSDEPLSAEIVFVQASAAVGKSVTAQYLSSSRNVPLLNLANVPVSTHSLVGLIQSDFSSGVDAVAEFHAGRLPIIIDALDEGRLLSGEQAFEGFLDTTGELVQRDRTVTNCPKLIFFGRHESSELAQLGLQMAGSGISTCTVEVDFFGEESARELIDAYACASPDSKDSYLSDPPVRDLIDAYFDAIEAALGLNQGTLWSNEHGRAFAGYAPVLAALGSLLSEITNPIIVTNRLKEGGSKEAWGVIDTVLQEVLDREQNKLREQLTQNPAISVPDEEYDQVYDREEQLTYLARLVHHQSFAASGRVNLSGPAHTTYLSMVGQYLPEHPFIRQGEVANPVLGSVILGHAVSHDLLGNADLSLLKDLSQQPFLWRSISQQLDRENSLIDGRYLGCILNSFWNDPAIQNRQVVIRSIQDDGSARVRVGAGTGSEVDFEVTSPLNLFGQARDCDVDVNDTITLEGRAPRNSTSSTTFYIHGVTAIICDVMEISSATITMGGKVWLEANKVTSDPHLKLYLKNGTEVGRAGQISERPPWTQLPSTLSAPYPRQEQEPILNLIDECHARLPMGSTLILNDDFSIPENDARTSMRWANRDYPAEFCNFIRLMVEHGLATSEIIPASGIGRKIRVRFRENWADLHTACQDPSATSSELQVFVAEVRGVFQ